MVVVSVESAPTLFRIVYDSGFVFYLYRQCTDTYSLLFCVIVVIYVQSWPLFFFGLDGSVRGLLPPQHLLVFVRVLTLFFALCCRCLSFFSTPRRPPAPTSRGTRRRIDWQSWDCQSTEMVSDSNIRCHAYVLRAQLLCGLVSIDCLMVLDGKADLVKKGFSFAELPTVAAALCSLVFTSDTPPGNREASAQDM